MKILDAGLEEADTVFQVMRLAFEEYRGLLYPESGALRETLEDVYPVGTDVSITLRKELEGENL